MAKRRRRRRFHNKAAQQARKPVAAPVCDCEGPPDGKYNSHLQSCPVMGGSGSGGAYAGTTYASCKHWRQEFELLEGLKVYASSWMDRPKFYDADDVEEETIDIGFYLDDMWTGGTLTASPGLDLPWVLKSRTKVIHFPWVDQSAPHDIRKTKSAIDWLLKSVQENKVIDVGCIGGHGRTGTVLALLLIAQGSDPWDAAKQVRKEYCDSAIESWAQEKFLGEMWSQYNKGQEPRPSDLPTYTTKYPTKYTYNYKNDVAFKSSGGWAAEAAAKYPKIMDNCPGCGNSVYVLTAHRDKCNGHPTDEEITAHHNKQALLNNLKDNTVDVTEQIKESVDAFKDELMREQNDDIPDQKPDDRDEYEDWLRLNTEGNRKAGLVDWDDYQTVVEGTQADYIAMELRQAQMDEVCPYGSCLYPIDCDPEGGGCFKQMTSRKHSDDGRADYEGWCGI